MLINEGQGMIVPHPAELSGSTQHNIKGVLEGRTDALPRYANALYLQGSQAATDKARTPASTVRLAAGSPVFWAKRTVDIPKQFR